MGKLGDLVYDDLMARGKSVYTARQWRSKVNEFVACCGERPCYDRNDVILFLAMMRDAGWRQSSIEVGMRPVKLLAQLQRWPGGWPRLAMKKVRDDEVNRPIFSHGEVVELIRRGKQVLAPRELAALALSTTYGLRREEICTAEVSFDKVKINTAKGGRVVEHLIPDQVRPFIDGHRRTEVRFMTRLFHRIVEKTGVELRGSFFGWHSIRRALATELISTDVSMLNLLRFMRWSDATLKGEFGMLTVYAARDQGQIDSSIFSVHPYLSAWREKAEVKVINDEKLYRIEPMEVDGESILRLVLVGASNGK